MPLATNDIQRSIGKMVIYVNRAMQQREHAGDLYSLAQREEQFQIQVSGTVNATPAEQVVPMQFTLRFASDPGGRDSSLEVPQVRIGWEFAVRPAGFVPYAHVQSWTYDDADMVSGCVLSVGVFAPAVLVGTETYRGVLHIAFHGWGAPVDTDTDIAPGGGADD